jgi:hypothetical protein
VGQAALLAAIARSPARVDPWRDPEAARRAMVRCSVGCAGRAGSMPSWSGCRRGGPGPRPTGPCLRRSPPGGGPRRQAGGARPGPRGRGADDSRPGAAARRGAVGPLRAGRRPSPRPGRGAGPRQPLRRGAGVRRIGGFPRRRRRGPERRSPCSPPAGQRPQALRLRTGAGERVDAGLGARATWIWRWNDRRLPGCPGTTTGGSTGRYGSGPRWPTATTSPPSS